MLNKATKIMNKQREEREAAANKCYATISDAQEALKVLGFEVVSADEVIDVTPITINKGQIVKVETTDDELIEELKMQLDIAKEEIAYYHDVEKDYINDVSLFQEEISNLKDELEIKEGVLNHMKKVHKCEIEELEDKIKELNRRIEALQMFNDAEDEIFEEEQETIKGGDAVKAQPEQPKRNPLLDKIKKAKEFTLEEAVISAQADAERKAEEKEEAKSQFPKYSLEYEQITFDESIDSRTMFGVRGTITFDEASYFFEATNNHHMPIVYGCYDEDVIRLTKDIIMHEIERFSFMNEREVGAADYRYAKDETFPVVAWRLTDDKGNITYHGYSCTKQYSYILTWDKKFNKNYVGRKLVKNAFSSAPNMWKKLSNKQLADKFMAVCASIWPEDFTNDDNDPEPTKDKKQHQTTKEFFKITKEQHQSTKEIIWDTPIDNIGETKEQHQQTNDEEFDAAADDLDL
jgi:hypothetical protein